MHPRSGPFDLYKPHFSSLPLDKMGEKDVHHLELCYNTGDIKEVLNVK